MTQLLNCKIEAIRGGYIEDRHQVSMVIMNDAGEILFTAGNPNLSVHMRSSAKAFQGQVLFQSGAVEKYDLSLKELSLCCASHDGTADHIATAQGILKKICLDENALNCGAHLPSDPDSKHDLLSNDRQPTAIYNNCSGKHAGMLAATLAMGADIATYEAIEHPLQQAIFDCGKALSGMDEIPYGIDGCSLPAFIMPLTNAAKMYTAFVSPETAPEKYQTGLAKIFEAMQAHPEMIAGPDSVDTQIMQVIPTLAAKRGAQGYYGMAIKDTKYGNLGITLKVEDGSNGARDVFIVKLLEFLEVLSPDVPMVWRDKEIRNHRGILTGNYQASIETI